MSGRRTRRRPLASKRQARERLRAQDVEFQAMQPIPAFKIDLPKYSPNGDFECYRTVIFRRGDDAIFNSEDDPSGNTWVGHIQDIRATHDRSTVLAQTRWYYSRHDASLLIKSFDIHQCSSHERVLADEFDYTSPYTFRERVYVHEYDERALDSPPINEYTHFVRTTLQVKRKLFKPPLGEGTCVCHTTYNPYPGPSNPIPEKARMHFCPSAGCRKWFHAHCLAERGCIDHVCPASTRGLRLLAGDPDKDMKCADQISIIQALELFQHSPSIVMHLPESLTRIAQCPIVRQAGAPNGWAIGNVADVVLARRFIYAAIEYSGNPGHSSKYQGMADRYEARLENKLGFETDRDEPELEGLQRLCEELSEFSLLATVYNPYWDKRWETYEKLGAELDGPAYICPQCRNAI